jgi:hypothetical protein
MLASEKGAWEPTRPWPGFVGIDDSARFLTSMVLAHPSCIPPSTYVSPLSKAYCGRRWMPQLSLVAVERPSRLRHVGSSLDAFLFWRPILGSAVYVSAR